MILIFAIEYDAENEGPEERRIRTKCLEKGLSDAARIMDVKLAGRSDDYPLNGEDKVSNCEVNYQSELASLSRLIESQIADDDEERA